MAANSNVKILNWSSANWDVVKVPKKASEAIAVGDPIEINTGSVEVVDSAENETFLGIALEASEAADTHLNFPVATLCIVYAKLASSSVAFGESVKYNAGANGTDWTFVPDNGDGIMWALEPVTAGNYGKFLVNTKQLVATTTVFQQVANS